MTDSATLHDAYAAYDCYLAEALFGLCYEFVQPAQHLLDLGIGSGLSAASFRPRRSARGEHGLLADHARPLLGEGHRRRDAASPVSDCCAALAVRTFLASGLPG